LEVTLGVYAQNINLKTNRKSETLFEASNGVDLEIKVGKRNIC
jgi:hypothetical protein